MENILVGRLVRFTAEEPEAIAQSDIRWQRDSEFHRLLDSEPAQLTSEKKRKADLDEREKEDFTAERYAFSVRTLADDRYIGFLSLWVIPVHCDAFVGLGIGDRDFWGKGYGTDMMEVALKYAFLELNLFRVSLGLHEYNPRALKSYQKAGFTLEGRTRQEMQRAGRRFDSLWMGILRDEWLQRQNGEQT